MNAAALLKIGFFYLGLDDSGCKNIKLNYLKNVEKRFTKEF